MSKRSDPETRELTFEAAMKRLDEIVRTMESGDLPLEQMITAYEEGRTLLKFCDDKLNEVERKIEWLEKQGEGWTAVETPPGQGGALAEPLDAAKGEPHENA